MCDIHLLTTKLNQIITINTRTKCFYIDYSALTTDQLGPDGQKNCLTSATWQLGEETFLRDSHEFTDEDPNT